MIKNFFANINILILLFIILLAGCRTHIKVKEIKMYPVVIKEDSGEEEKLAESIKPYQIALRNKLSDTLIYNAHNLDKKGKVPGLGILTSDAMIFLADSIFGKKDYVVWMNRGGLRTELSRGFLTVGNIYELMPFDNTICMVEINEETYKENKEVLKNKDFIIIDRGKSSPDIIEEKMKRGCYVLLSDFLLNGGDGIKIMNKPSSCSSYFIRDAIIRFLKMKRKNSDTLNLRTI